MIDYPADADSVVKAVKFAKELQELKKYKSIVWHKYNHQQQIILWSSQFAVWARTMACRLYSLWKWWWRAHHNYRPLWCWPRGLCRWACWLVSNFIFKSPSLDHQWPCINSLGFVACVLKAAAALGPKSKIKTWFLLSHIYMKFIYLCCNLVYSYMVQLCEYMRRQVEPVFLEADQRWQIPSGQKEQHSLTTTIYQNPHH